MFTKLFKPAVAILRSPGIRVILYLDDMLIMAGGSQTPFSHSNASLDGSGVYPQPQQEHFDTHSVGDFLGSLPGFVYLADLFTDFKNPVRTVDDQRDSSSETGNNFKALSAAGINDNNIATHMYDHPAVLPAPLYSYYHHLERTKVANSSEAQSELQHSGNNPWMR